MTLQTPLIIKLNHMNQYDYVSICPISGADILQVKSSLKYFILIEMSIK